MKSFSRKQQEPWVEFDVDGEVFRIASSAPATAILDVARVNEAKDLEKLRIVMEFLDQVLDDDSADRFAKRLKSKDNPITVDQCADVATWAMEEVYATTRPTPGPSQSQPGSDGTGTSSSESASSEGSTQDPATRRIA